ncbi:uncharacterized protein LOC123319194 [Coccinella septempunctata]|uniref:uncharacterized protein LOC123319194 n=1 Tax=Coccinella septempunctata TaxID=41139 RepID=UPI001D088A98|nr:uncharacterized protein LOC123319194 [Coccinella septempunctata]
MNVSGFVDMKLKFLHHHLLKTLHTIEYEVLVNKLEADVFFENYESDHIRSRKLHSLIKTSHQLNNISSYRPDNDSKHVDRPIGDSSLHTFHGRFTNLSDTQFTLEEITLLNLGHKFAPTPQKFNMQTTAIDLEIQLRKHPVYGTLYGEFGHILNNYNRRHSTLHYNTPGLTKRQFTTTLKSIRHKISSNNLTVTRADKNAGLVILPTSVYNEKTLKFFEDNNIHANVTNILTRYTTRLNKLLRTALPTLQKFTPSLNIHNIKEKNPQIPNLYSLIKLHKVDKSIRPITSAHSSPAHKVSKVINHILTHQLGYKSPMSVKNSIELVNIIESTKLDSNNEYILVSFDIVNLYTNIPVAESLSLLREFLNGCQTLRDFNIDNEDIQTIMNLMELISKQNFFSFNGSVYTMTDGVPMGSPISGLLAEIFVAYLESLIIKHHLSHKIILWRRYVDDIFCIWSGTLDELNSFLTFINSLSRIKFTLEISDNNNINFLDLNITLNPDNSFNYNIYRKPTQTDVVIPKFSYHSPQIKRTAFYFLLNRLLNIPLTKTDYNKELGNIYKIATNNGYPVQFVDNILASIEEKRIYKKVYPHTPIKKTYVVVPYFHGFNCKLKSLLSNHDLSLINSSHKTLERLLVNNKPKKNNAKKSGIYKINCDNCPAFYIGMTTRAAGIRFNEHVKNRPASAMGGHLHENEHSASLEGLTIIHESDDFWRLTLLEQLEILKNKNSEHLLNEIKDFPNPNLFKLVLFPNQ